MVPVEWGKFTGGSGSLGGTCARAYPMGTERWINVVSWVKYGRDVGDVIHNVVSTSMIRRRNITEYSTSSKRRDLECIRRHCRQSNATLIGSRNDVVGYPPCGLLISKKTKQKERE